MSDVRDDVRDKAPRDSHRSAFLGGWTDAINGKLYATIQDKKTHRNMGNLFGWIYGDKPRAFRLETWYRYLGNASGLEGDKTT